jgi:hypothetical protein
MPTPAVWGQHSRDGLRYETDLTDAVRRWRCGIPRQSGEKV